MGEWDKKKIIAVGSLIVLLVGLGVGVVLAQQQVIFNNRAAEPVSGRLNCDAGPNPWSSTEIHVTNNTNERIEDIQSVMWVCEYEPDRVVTGHYKCETCEDGDEVGNPNCQIGVRDPDRSTEFSLDPGESHTVSWTANPCEIIQFDVYNEETHVEDSPRECYNPGSNHTNPEPPAPWPGGIAFGINQNSTGYNPATGTCPQPTTQITPTNTPAPTQPQNSPTPTVTPVPPASPTPTHTPVPVPTVPPGQPTNTPVPSPTPIPCLYQCIPYTDCTGEGRQTTNGDCSSYGPDFVCCTPALGGGGPDPTVPPVVTTPVPTRPVAGAAEVTVLGIIGGVALIILAAFL